MLEGGHRVPAIITWPAKLPSGQECHVPLLTMDLFPTFARLAGVFPTGHHTIDGMDIGPILKGEDMGAQRVLHWRFDNQWAVHRGDWKLVDGRALYHLGNDPAETKNLAEDHPEIVREPRILDQKWTRDVGHR